MVEEHVEWRQRKAEEMASVVPMGIEGTVVVDGVEGQPAATAMVHQIWEAPMVRAQDATLGGELQPEVQLLKPVEEQPAATAMVHQIWGAPEGEQPGSAKI